MVPGRCPAVGEVVVRAPKRCSQLAITTFVREKQAWISHQLTVCGNRRREQEQKISDGEILPLPDNDAECQLYRRQAAMLDYVVVHELAHRKEMNHSQQFWQQVAAVMPEYQQYRRWLRDYGACLYTIQSEGNMVQSS